MLKARHYLGGDKLLARGRNILYGVEKEAVSSGTAVDGDLVALHPCQ